MISLYPSLSISKDIADQARFSTTPLVIKNAEDLKQLAGRRFHSPHKFKDGSRKKDNWLGADCIVLDVDDGCTIEAFQEAFRGVEYLIATSRSHQKPKGSGERLKAPCDRFHVYFPLSRQFGEEDALEYQQIIRDLLEKYQFFDTACADLARMFQPSGDEIVVLEANHE